MLNTAYRLSSKWKLFTEECEALKLTFSNLHYPSKLIDATINQFITNIVADILPSDTTTIFPWSCFCFLSLNRKLWSTQGDSYKILVLYVKSVSLYIQSQSSKKGGNTLNIWDLKPEILREQCTHDISSKWSFYQLTPITNQLLRTICQSSKCAGIN